LEALKSDSEMTLTGSNSCGKCSKMVKEKDDAVLCEWCNLWFHIRCHEMPKALYKEMKTYRYEGLKWFCVNCKDVIGNMTKLNDKVVGLESELKKAEAQMLVRNDQIENEMRDLKRNMDEAKRNAVAREEFQKMRADLDYMRKEGARRTMLDEMNAKIEEMRTSEQKDIENVKVGVKEFKKEVVMKGEMQEVQKELAQMRREVVLRKEVEEVKKSMEKIKGGATVVDVEKEVRKTFAEIVVSEREKEEKEKNSEEIGREMEMKVKEVMEREKRRSNIVVMGMEEESDEKDTECIGKMMAILIPEVGIKYEVMGRIGKKSDKIRPLRVKLTDLGDKRRVLSRAKNLKNEAGMGKIYIVPDLTKIQQTEDKKLREEVKSLRMAGIINVKISNGKVISEEAIKEKNEVRPN